MHTELKIKANGKQMSKLFDAQEKSFLIKFYELANKDNEANFDENEEYLFKVIVRHPEGINPKKEIENFLNS